MSAAPTRLPLAQWKRVARPRAIRRASRIRSRVASLRLAAPTGMTRYSSPRRWLTATSSSGRGSRAARKASSWASVGWPPVTRPGRGSQALGMPERASKGVEGMRGNGVRRRLPAVAIVGPVDDDLCPLEGYQSPSDHVVQLRQDRLDILLGVHALYDDRQVERETQHLLGVEPGGGPEARDPPEHGGPGEVPLAEQLHDRLVERAPVVLVPLADMDAHQGALAGQSVHAGPPRAGS